MPAQHRGKYDFVVASGIIMRNFCDECMLQQMVICCKNQGYIVFAARFSYMGDFWYVDVMKSFEKLGRVRAVDEEEFFKYD